MVTLNWPMLAPVPGDMRWLRVEEPSAVAACRSAALTMASRLQFPTTRADEVALAVSEAASNLHKHAQQGALLLAVSRESAEPGIDLVTIDGGPGFGNVAAAMRDGHSTAGSLGIGLGAIRRLADFCDLYSMPGRSSALVARFWPRAGSGQADVHYSGLIRPISGETECGDNFGAVRADGTLTAVMCDGLGHGPLAAKASSEAIAAVFEDVAGEPAGLLQRVHQRLGSTRGAAIGIVQLTPGLARFAGLGNIAATVLSGGKRKGMLSVPGIAGHQARSIRQFEYEVPAGAAVILHSDGLSARWEAGALPGLENKDPLVIAATLLAEAGIHRDDAGVLVLKP